MSPAMSKKSKTPARATPAPDSSTLRRQPSANKLLLHKGVLCALIGLAVLISPHFIQSPALQQAVGGSSLVGWFSLVLGLAFVGQYLWQRRSRPH
jgi:hypothetical protein